MEILAGLAKGLVLKVPHGSLVRPTAVRARRAMFDSLGIESYLIDLGGEVIARGAKPDGRPWRVGIERPSAAGLVLSRHTPFLGPDCS